MLSINQFLLENENKKKYNLEKIFWEIDKRGFKGVFKEVSGLSVNRNVKFKWNGRIKSGLGFARAYFSRVDGVILLSDTKLPTIEINPNYKYSKEQLYGIMAHEMVHMFMYFAGDIHENHGAKFIDKCNEVSKLANMPVPSTESTDGIDRLNDKPKEYFIVVTNTQGIALFQTSKKNAFIDRFGDNKRIIYTGIIKTSIYKTYPVQRSVKSISFHKADKQALEELSKLGIPI